MNERKSGGSECAGEQLGGDKEGQGQGWRSSERTKTGLAEERAGEWSAELMTTSGRAANVRATCNITEDKTTDTTDDKVQTAQTAETAGGREQLLVLHG